jgi:alpha-L-rhamnosidase
LGAGRTALRAVLTRTECIDRPLGLEVAQPRFSWAIQSTDHNVRQKAYHIRVASEPGLLSGARADLWDSGVIRTDSCFDVPYKGATLHAGQRAWWSVQVWDERDEASAPSEPTWFEMG